MIKRKISISQKVRIATIKKRSIINSKNLINSDEIDIAINGAESISRIEVMKYKRLYRKYVKETEVGKI